MRAKIILKHVCLQSTGWLKLLKKTPVQALLETIVSSGKIKILEIHVVALKSDATVSAVLQQRKGESIEFLDQCWIFVLGNNRKWSALRYTECLIKTAKKCLGPALCAAVPGGYPR